MEACELARQYNIPECENSLLQQLRDQTALKGKAISAVLDKAGSLSMPQLELLALEKCSSMLITPTAFLGFSPSALDLCLSAAHLKASEASVLEAVIRGGKDRLSTSPHSSLKLVLAHILPKLQLESIPVDILQQMVQGLDLLSAQEISAVRCSQMAQEQPCLSRQYARRPWGELGPDITCTDIDIIEFKSQQHQGARSRHCLRAGTGSYVWHLSVDRYSSCTWIGLVDEAADMSRQASFFNAWTSLHLLNATGAVAVGSCHGQWSVPAHHNLPVYACQACSEAARPLHMQACLAASVTKGWHKRSCPEYSVVLRHGPCRLHKWLGNQQGCWMMGSNGSLAAAAPQCDCCSHEFGCPVSPTEKVRQVSCTLPAVSLLAYLSGHVSASFVVCDCNVWWKLLCVSRSSLCFVLLATFIWAHHIKASRAVSW